MEGMNTALGIPAEDVRIIEHLRTQLSTLVLNMARLQEKLFIEPETPPNWAVLQSHAQLLKTHLSTLQEYLSTPVDRPANAPAHLANKTYTISDILHTLTPHPIPPFPVQQPSGQFVINELIRKPLPPDDEKYIRKSVTYASDFCSIPSDWELERLPLDDKNKELGGSGDPAKDDAVKREVERRMKTELKEEEVERVWSEAAQEVSQLYVLFLKAVKGVDDEDPDLDRVDELAEEIGAPDDGEREELREAGRDQQTKDGQGDLPILPVGSLLRFMAVGEVNR